MSNVATTSVLPLDQVPDLGREMSTRSERATAVRYGEVQSDPERYMLSADDAAEDDRPDGPGAERAPKRMGQQQRKRKASWGIPRSALQTLPIA